jgi:peptidyl-prolyl cis-trans isomerase D
MRQSLQKGIGRIVLYLFIGLLVVSFAVWGVADFLTGESRQSIATVGTSNISPEEYQRSYQRQIATYSAQIGRQITTDEARAAGLPRQILDGLISRAAVTEQAQNLGIGVSEEAIRREIMQDESFHDAGGNFSRSRFEQILAANDLTEAGYVEELRGELLRRQLLGAFTQGAVVSDVLMEAANRYQNEQRVLSYFVIGRAAAGEIAAPAEDVLRSFYEERKAQFGAPEYRRVSLVLATPSRVRERISVSEDDLRQLYKAEIDEFRTPESRRLEQISFPTREAAEKAAAELAKGKEFLKVAQEAGFQQSDIDLGTVTKAGMVDPKIAEAAFSLAKGEISKPVEGAFTTALVRVVDIIPGEEKTFEEVREAVQKRAIDSRVSQELSRLANAFEDDHTAGMPIAEAAKKHGLAVEEVTLDRQGRAPDGKSAAPDAANPALYNAIFLSDVGVENEPVRLEQGAYAWFDVIETIAPRQKSFEEVRDEAAASWTNEQVASKLTELAQTLRSRVEGGEPIKAVAESVNATLVESKPLKRGDVEPGIPISTVAQAFALPLNGVNTVSTPDRLSRVVFQVARIIEPEPLAGLAATNLRNQLSQSIATDTLAQYIAGVRTSLGASINQRSFSVLAGTGEAAN